MTSFLHDIRFGLRTLLKSPGFTLVAVITLGLGIGANTAIFSVIYAVLLKPLPFTDPDHIVMIWESNQKSASPIVPVSPPNFRDWKERSRSFSSMAARHFVNYNLSDGVVPERLAGESVTTDYFNVLGVKPLAGRFFTSDEGTSAAGRVAVISNNLWQRRFNADRGIIGRMVKLNNTSHTVVGIAPDDHRGLIEVWTPIETDKQPEDRGWHSLQVVARLAPGVTLEKASGEMKGITAQLARDWPSSNTDWDATVVPLQEQIVQNIRPTLLVLLGAVGFVLLIACANVANLLLARVAARGREIAIRTVLGASRGRVVRQLLTESLLLAVMGGGVGVLLALWGTDFMAGLQSIGIPRAGEIRVDTNVLLFALGLSLLTGIIFGLLPAIHASKLNLSEPLKEGSRNFSTGKGGRRIRGILVLGEVALALLLLTGAGLLIRSFATLQQIETGFNPHNVLTMQFVLPESRYADLPTMSGFYDALLLRLRALPGVVSASTISSLPLAQGGIQFHFTVAGRPMPQQHNAPVTYTRIIGTDYFRTMEIPLLKGRSFTEADITTSTNVAVVNETMAKKMWPGEESIGKRLTIGIPIDMPPDSIPWITVVGVVRDVKHSALNQESGMELYVPYRQFPFNTMSLVIRTKGDPMAIAPMARSEAIALDRDLPLFQIQTLENVVGTSLAQSRFYTLLLSIFAGVALLLAALGIYGVIANAVAQQTREIGIRLALGAGRRDILRLVVGRAALLSLAGVVVGLLLALALTRLLENLLYGVTPTDPVTFAGVASLLALVALVASYIPARKAMKVDPMVALRYE